MVNQSKFLFNGVDYGSGSLQELNETNIQDNTQVVTIDNNSYSNLNRQRKQTTIEITYARKSTLGILMNQLVKDDKGTYSKTLDTNAQSFGGNLIMEVILEDDKTVSKKYKIVVVQKVEPKAATINLDGNTDALFDKATIICHKLDTLIY